ncbi:hypothetical protein TNCV_1426491 [Trichonephila clavipes]|nr:hypothetical protein TNCV_1426491 [Trichonephila clavipes]
MVPIRHLAVCGFLMINCYTGRLIAEHLRTLFFIIGLFADPSLGVGVGGGGETGSLHQTSVVQQLMCAYLSLRDLRRWGREYWREGTREPSPPQKDAQSYKLPSPRKQSGHGSLVVKLTNSWPACQEFEPGTAEEPLRREENRCTLTLSRLKHPFVGVVWKSAQVSSSSLEHGSKIRGPSLKALE